HSVDEDTFAALGKDGFVINIARGSVIDEAALVHALSTGVLSGAGLDVFESEPAVPQELLSMPRVAVTPHMGSDTDEVQDALLRLVLSNLEAFFAGRPLLTPIPDK
ncbi:MAG: NAD(P)-dependent oxidoreductase, partial [Chthoniobacterales bacterium]